MLCVMVANIHRVVEDEVVGIPRFAAFQNSNDSFCIFRKFGLETTRLLYHRESELDKLSAKIHELDLKDAANPAMRYRLISAEHEEWYPDKAQKELLDEYQQKIGAYCQHKCSIAYSYGG
jgi:hypothetical protein